MGGLKPTADYYIAQLEKRVKALEDRLDKVEGIVEEPVYKYETFFTIMCEEFPDNNKFLRLVGGTEEWVWRDSYYHNCNMEEIFIRSKEDSDDGVREMHITISDNSETPLKFVDLQRILEFGSYKLYGNYEKVKFLASQDFHNIEDGDYEVIEREGVLSEKDLRFYLKVNAGAGLWRMSRDDNGA